MPRSVEDRLRAAARQLKAARDNIELGNYETVVNRAYYAAFEAAHAALAAWGVPRPKTHAGVARQFTRHHYEKRRSKEASETLRQLYRDRLVADYDGEVPDAAQADSALRGAADFVVAIRDDVLPTFEVE